MPCSAWTVPVPWTWTESRAECSSPPESRPPLESVWSSISTPSLWSVSGPAAVSHLQGGVGKGEQINVARDFLAAVQLKHGQGAVLGHGLIILEDHHAAMLAGQDQVLAVAGEQHFGNKETELDRHIGEKACIRPLCRLRAVPLAWNFEREPIPPREPPAGKRSAYPGDVQLGTSLSHTRQTLSKLTELPLVTLWKTR